MAENTLHKLAEPTKDFLARIRSFRLSGCSALGDFGGSDGARTYIEQAHALSIMLETALEDSSECRQLNNAIQSGAIRALTSLIELAALSYEEGLSHG